MPLFDLPSRRAVTKALGAAMLTPSASLAAAEARFFVGTYASPTGGLTPLTYSPGADTWSLGTPDRSIVNVSFGVFSRRFNIHYLLDEQQAGEVGAYRWTGRSWIKLGSVTTGGAAPCHVSLDAAERAMVVANYDSGSVAFYRLDENTGLPSAPDLHQDLGSGPNRDRQAGPHAHWTGFSPDQRFLYTVDLGADRIFAYPYDVAKVALGPVFTAIAMPPGNGPRHMAFHPHLPLVYVVSELGNTLTVLSRRPDGKLAHVETLSTLPPGFAAHNQAAEIAIDRDGGHVYVSNRGHNSIALFSLSPDGRARASGHVPSGGDWPRFFLLLEDDRRLVVANERSGDLAVFKLDGAIPKPAGTKLVLPKPVFIAPL